MNACNSVISVCFSSTACSIPPTTSTRCVLGVKLGKIVCYRPLAQHLSVYLWPPRHVQGLRVCVSQCGSGPLQRRCAAPAARARTRGEVGRWECTRYCSLTLRRFVNFRCAKKSGRPSASHSTNSPHILPFGACRQPDQPVPGPPRFCVHAKGKASSSSLQQGAGCSFRRVRGQPWVCSSLSGSL